MQIKPLLEKSEAKKNAVIFVSGSGTNAEKILEKWTAEKNTAAFNITAIITDRPKQSRAGQIAETYNIPLVENDIREFYNKNGLKRITIRTAEGQKVREAWTDALREQLKDYTIDFGILAGFVPLTNITGDFPCLNVHPGDLTYLKDGKRYLVGLHTIPIERAILEGLDGLSSSVILAEPYSDKGDDMDCGIILGISDNVPVELGVNSFEELQKTHDNRPSKKPRGGFSDILSEIADKNLENLKVNGDWIVFPQVIFDFAAGKFGVDDERNLYYLINSNYHPIENVIYGKKEKEILFRD